nr:asparagine synthase-related protein [Candidatus Acidoferrales bacterium]
MSGIVGILQLDGAPVDGQLLQRLTDFQSFRGPDAKQIWLDGNVGLGHTLLRATEESERETQPFTLGDGVWIVADARIDGQRELIAELQANGQQIPSRSPDVELILRSYQVWGEDCLNHLIGDFTFGIWDGPRKQLFCARDQMGVKCFYFAHIGSQVIFSNSIDCIRQHPSVSDRLNDLAIADHLLFETNLDQSTTSFADIQRLPPANKASWSSGTLRTGRYWTTPIEEPVFYRRASDYTDRLMELMRQAVGDRLRTRRVGILMSGGLDSPTIAAVARDLSQKHAPPIELRAFTHDSRYNPDEKHYARMVARQLQIPIEYHDWESEWGSRDWEHTPFRSAQPEANVNSLAIRRKYWRTVGSRSRVFLQGEGPDNALYIEWKPYIAYLVRRRRFARLFLNSCQYLAWHRRIPFWGRISRSFKNGRSKGSSGPTFPEWINRDLETRFGLRERWEKYYSPPPLTHPVRPLNHALLFIPGEFQELFRSQDAECTGSAVEVRYPFMDLRVLRFFMVVPSIPWCRNKYLLRRAMKGILPEAVLRRRKTGTPHTLTIDQAKDTALAPLEPASGFSHYVDTARLTTVAGGDEWESGGILLARLLNHWLRYSHRTVYNLPREANSDGLG